MLIMWIFRFPADYRTYLLDIGNGIGMGEGPCREGILPFGRTPFGYPLGFTELVKNIRKPFPFNEENKVLGNNNTIQLAEEEEDIIVRREQPSQLKNRDIGGYLTIGTSTRSYDHFWILICEGDCRGEVWIVTWWGSFFPCTPRMTFRDWLKDWVEDGGHKLEQSLQNTKSYPAVVTASRSMNTRSLFAEDEEESSITASFFNRFNSTLRRLRTRQNAFDSLENLQSYYFDSP